LKQLSIVIARSDSDEAIQKQLDNHDRRWHPGIPLLRPDCLARSRRDGYTVAMKNILLCGINARYSHSCLALLCLKHAAPENLPIDIAEFSINDRPAAIADAVIAACPDAAAFSCYIWNIEHVLKVASTVKKALPECFILLGGPEVSYDAQEMMAQYPFIDMIVRGPGEAAFAHFAARFCAGQDAADTPSACVRTGEKICENPAAPAWDMNDTRFMYGDLSMFAHRTIYYETSRGCPFRCAYCLSADEPVSFLPLDRVERELEYFIAADVRQVKLVDRTFNYPAERAKTILRAMIRLKKQYPASPTNFHLEISACLLDEETMTLLISAPQGMLQIEAGIQSTHDPTLRAVRRSHDTGNVLRSIAALCALPNLRVHADLIAGLPEEGWDEFARSFDDAYGLHPAALQVGFLKLLRGSALRREAEEWGIVYTDYPPYEVIRTPVMTYGELSALHRIAELVDILYNSGSFAMSLERFVAACGSPFAFFSRTAEHFHTNGYFDRPQPTQRSYALLADLSSDMADGETLCEALAYDWCRRGEGGQWPKGVPIPAQPAYDTLRHFYSTPEKLQQYLPECVGLSPRQIERRCRVYAFPRLFKKEGWVLFDRGHPGGESRECRVEAI